MAGRAVWRVKWWYSPDEYIDDMWPLAETCVQCGPTDVLLDGVEVRLSGDVISIEKVAETLHEFAQGGGVLGYQLRRGGVE
jgi:hypothetical protein